MSSFPNYKNKTLPSKSPKMKKNRLLKGEGNFTEQSFLHSSNCYVIHYKYGPTMKNHIGKSLISIFKSPKSILGFFSPGKGVGSTNMKIFLYISGHMR